MGVCSLGLLAKATCEADALKKVDVDNIAKITACGVEHAGVENECAFFKCRIDVLAFSTAEYKAVDKCVMDTCKCKEEPATPAGGCDMDSLLKADCDDELKA